MLPGVSPTVRPGASGTALFRNSPTIPSSHINFILFGYLTPIKMEAQKELSRPAIAHLCDVLLEKLRNFADADNEIQAFGGEVRTLRKFLDLIDRVFKAKLARMAFEEQHFTSVEILLNRCRTTLSRLSEILAPSGPRAQDAGSQDGLQETLKVMQSSEVVALRARIGFYIKTLQMSLQTVKL